MGLFQMGIDFFHGPEKVPAFFPGKGIEIVHILEQLPGVVVHHPQDMQQALIAFGVDVQRRGAEFGQRAMKWVKAKLTAIFRSCSTGVVSMVVMPLFSNQSLIFW